MVYVTKVKVSGNRDCWIDLLKIIACFLVVVNHTGGYLLEYSGLTPGATLFYSINFSICKIGVPLFIMISGYLLLKRCSDFKDMFKRITRVLVPLIVLSAIFYFRAKGFSIENVDNFIFDFIKEPVIIPFWYLYMLIGLYLVTPFIQKMVKNFETKDFRYLIIICLLIPATIPVICYFFKISINSNFTVALLPIYLCYYIAGLYISKIPLRKKYRNIALICFIVPIILFVCSMYIPVINGENISYALDASTYINVGLPALSSFYLMMYYFQNKKFGERTKQIISSIASVTFGIYLFHMFINYKIYNLVVMQYIFGFNCYLGILLVEILTFAICGIVTYFLKKIPYVKKYL